MNITKRVGALENHAGDRGFDKAHQVICRLGQSQEEALDAYGRDKIGLKDFVVVRTFITPRFDGEGNMIFHKDWPENQTSASGPKAT